MTALFETMGFRCLAHRNRHAATDHRGAAPTRRTLNVGRMLLAALAAAGAMIAAAPAAADDDQFKFIDGELGVNVYGFSYHFQRKRARDIRADNEFNPGLGLRYRFAEWKQWSFFADAGIFEDSGRKTATVAGAGALWHFGGGFRAGGALVFFDSDTYNRGNAFIAPLPMASYDIGPVTVNAAYFPKVSRYNEIATLGIWFTFWPKRW